MTMMIKTVNPLSEKSKNHTTPDKTKMEKIKTTDTSVIIWRAAPITNVEMEISTRQKQ